MDQAGPSKDAIRTSDARTLGDVLYEGRTHASMSEEEWYQLVRSTGAGDQVALRTLYDLAHRIVFTLMVRITRNREMAEELTVDVFHDVWKRASTYDPANGSVLGWIMNQARSRAIDRLRYEGRKKRVGDETTVSAITVTSEDPHSAFDLKERSLVLREAVNGLDPEERQAIELAFFGELTHQEVAVNLNQPLGTVKSRIRSGLSKLRHALVRAVECIKP